MRGRDIEMILFYTTTEAAKILRVSTQTVRNYIYAGKLAGVNDKCIKLTNAKIVYDTGGLEDKQWRDAQKLPGDWYVQCSAIESFGLAK